MSKKTTCPNCFYLNDENAVICVKCQKSLTQNAPDQNLAHSDTKDFTNPIDAFPKQKLVSIKKSHLIFGACCTVVLILILLFALFGSERNKPAVNNEETTITTTETTTAATTAANTTTTTTTQPATTTAYIQEAQNDYLFPSDSQYLTFEILSNYSESEIGYICNEMYARYGYIFKKEKYKKYFSAKSWYTPKYESMEYVVTLFNKYEEENLQTIADYRDYMGW